MYLEETVDWGWLKVKLYQINSYFWLEFWLVRRSWWLLLWLWATTEITFLSLILAGVQSSHHTGWHSVSSPVSTTSRCGEERRVKWIISTCQGKLFSKIFQHFLCCENLLFIRRVEGGCVVEMRTGACFMFTYHKPGPASANTWHWDIAGNKFNVSRAADKVSQGGWRTVLVTNLLLWLYGQTITIQSSIICGLFYLVYWEQEAVWVCC